MLFRSPTESAASHSNTIVLLTNHLSKGEVKLTVIFEPHRYSRVKDCWKDFFTCFEGVDPVVVLLSNVCSGTKLPVTT